VLKLDYLSGGFGWKEPSNAFTGKIINVLRDAGE
jgi:hypothetical protein